MKHKGKRYRFIEGESPKNKTLRVIEVILILSFIAVGIISTVIFSIILEPTVGEMDETSHPESMTLGVELVTDPVPTYPTRFVLPSETTESSEPTEEPKKRWLIDIDNPDYNYNPEPIYLTEDDRYLIAKTVMREFGDGGYEACCLQAQAFRDAMVLSQASAEYTYKYFQYDAYPLVKEPSPECYEAVDYIFAGNMAVPHRVLYMYAPEYVTSKWHESQTFVVSYNGVRFFDLAE